MEEQTQAEDGDIFCEETTSQVCSPEKGDDTDSTEYTLWDMESSNKDLSKRIEMEKEKIKMLKDIVSKQLENQQELQMKYEEENIALSQIPKNRQISTERYEEALEISTNLQSKQCEFNQILEKAFVLYDHTSQFVETVRAQFNEELMLTKQRKLIYEADIAEIKEIGGNLLSNLKQRINDKKLLSEIAENNLSKYNADDEDEKIGVIREKIKGKERDHHGMNETIIKIQEEIQQTLKKREHIEKSFAENELNSSKKMEKLENLLKNEEYSFNKNQLEIEELHRLITELNESNDKTKKNTAVEKDITESLRKKINDKDMIIEKLSTELNKIKIDVSELATISKTINDKDEFVNKLKETVENLEEKLECKEISLENLDMKCNSFKERVLETELELSNNIKMKKDIEERIEAVRAETESVNLEVNNKEKELKEKEEEILSRISEVIGEDNIIANSIAELEKEIEAKKEALEKLNEKLKLNLELEEKTKEVEKLEDETNLLEIDIASEVRMYEGKCALAQSEVMKLKEHIELVSSLKQDTANENTKHESSLAQFNEQCESVKNTYNRNIDIKLKEFEELKKSLSVEEEKFNDESSKINFQYYTLKNEIRSYTSTLNYCKSVINRCKTEKIIMHSYLDWISEKSSTFKNKNDSDNGDDEEENEEEKGSVGIKRDAEDSIKVSSGSGSSSDLPLEEFVMTKTPLASQSKGPSCSKMPESQGHSTPVITIHSSDSDAAGFSKFHSRQGVTVFVDKKKPQPIKRLAGRQKRRGKMTALNKDKKKTILDVVIDSS